jgi:HSP20 family protein
VSSLVRWDPFREVSDLQRTINRLLDNVASTPAAGFPVDVYETPAEVVIRADLPGVPAEQIRVQHHDGQVFIRATRKTEAPQDATWWCRQAPEGEMVRALNLSVPVDVDRIEARYDAGVLELHLPKAEYARPRDIPVVSGAQASGTARAIPAAAEAAATR